MLSHLDRKLWRDLRRMAGQAVAVSLVMACGLAMMIMARSLIYSLETTRQELRIAGIVLSPEFIFESRPGAALPDNRTYGIFWMGYKELASAFDLDGAFDYLTLTLAPTVSERPVIAALDLLLSPYGGRSAYGRGGHPSHIRGSGESRVLHILSVGFPIIFLSLATCRAKTVLSRLLSPQREPIPL